LEFVTLQSKARFGGLQLLLSRRATLLLGAPSARLGHRRDDIPSLTGCRGARGARWPCSGAECVRGLGRMQYPMGNNGRSTDTARQSEIVPTKPVLHN
ncbi:MAG: hypothetical protein QOD97_3019, partial [Mycobacterium sp.]|nr:hypothetical protein [Mycobacterium sp.]